MRHLYLIFAVILLAANTSCAASYDCAKAGTKVEKMICADPELSKLDEELGRVYSDDLKKYPDYVANFQAQQHAWLKERNKCETKECLRSTYQKRIAQLTPKEDKQASGSGNKEQCLKPSVDWSNYKWILMAGKGQAACEDMFAYLQARPEDASPPVCPEGRLPQGQDWSRPAARILTEAEKQALIRNMPEDKPWIKKNYPLNQAVLMQVITADITRDGIPETLLAYAYADYRKSCHRATQCAVDLNNKQEIAITEFETNSYSLLPMNNEGTWIDWNHPIVRPDPMLARGELVFYKGMPYWLSAPSWFQGSHDNPPRHMTPDNPYSAMFKLNGIGHSVIGQYGGPVKATPFSQVQHIRGDGAGCAFGYFSKENLKANPPKGKK